VQLPLLLVSKQEFLVRDILHFATYSLPPALRNTSLAEPQRENELYYSEGKLCSRHFREHWDVSVTALEQADYWISRLVVGEIKERRR
jgi:hypothetical protein